MAPSRTAHPPQAPRPPRFKLRVPRQVMPFLETTWLAESVRWLQLGMTFIALTYISTGLAYLPITDSPSSFPPGLDIVRDAFPLVFWGALWVFTGLLCLVCIATRFRLLFYSSWTLAVVLQGVWTASYAYGWVYEWIEKGSSRGFLNFGTYTRGTVPLIIVAGLIYAARKRRVL